MYATVLQSFQQDLAHVPAQVTAHLAQGDNSGAVRALHTLKGLAATVGASALSREAAALEALCKTELTAAAQVNLRSRLDAIVVGSTAQLQAVLALYQGATEPTGNAGALSAADAAVTRQDLLLLRAMLERSDMQALEVFARLRPAVFATHGALWDTLSAALAQLEFEDALAACNDLLSQIA